MNAIIFIIIFGAALLLLVVFLPVLNGVGSYKIHKPSRIRGHKSKSDDEDKSQDTSFVKFQLAEGTSSSLRAAILEEDEDDTTSVGQRVRSRNAAGREKLRGKGYDV
ncbi:hypothetical protein V1525DRAFT_454158 [Lipomyces kononenkoae]|uniref:Uncharacterized protein n=1 Tax=Lipomyces kononenkoae TaxID=34357 RepID=A0ACC3T8Z5_LIPKO